MNEEEKKAIEILKEIEINTYAEGKAIAIDTVLKLIKKLQKENEELKSNNEKYIIHLTDGQYKTVIEIAQNDINQKWIQKVKDKIEEILNNGEYRIIFEGDAEFPDEATCIDAQKYIKLEKLQELLEGRK